MIAFKQLEVISLELMSECVYNIISCSIYVAKTLAILNFC